MSERRRTGNIIAAGIFLFGVGGGLSLRLWASFEASIIVGPNQIQVTDDGSVVVAAGRHFYRFDYGEVLVGKTAAEDLGSDVYVGPMHALDPGTVLIRNDQVMDDSLERNLNAYARRRENPLALPSPEQTPVIQRCDLATGTCASHHANTTGQNNFFHSRRVFSITGNEAQDAFVVADTAAWELLLLDSAGAIVARRQGDFAFPNKVDWLDDGIWLADTNHHRLVRVSSEADRFGAVEQVVSIPEDTFDWPIAFARTRSGQFVVASANRAFDDSRVALLSQRGGLVRWLDLPDSADVLDVALWGDEILLADFRGFEVHRFSASGERRTPFGEEAFRDEMSELRDLKSTYQLLANLAFGLMGLALVALIIVQQRFR